MQRAWRIALRGNDMTITRRDWITRVAGAIAGGTAAAALIPVIADAASVPSIFVIYKDPKCGCCAKWVTHIQASGLKPVVKDRTDMDALKDSLGIPAALRSCHTAVYGKYLFEGHVPSTDVKKLIAEEPKGVLGLAVPGMPAGSPGMETGRTDKYDVVAFRADGTTQVFASHG